MRPTQRLPFQKWNGRLDGRQLRRSVVLASFSLSAALNAASRATERAQVFTREAQSASFHAVAPFICFIPKTACEDASSPAGSQNVWS